MKINYSKFSGFEYVFLEDSFVLKIKTNSLSADFNMEFVLTKNHQFYEKPKPNEMYCYKKGVINFPKVEEVVWTEVSMNPSIDIDSEVDFGNIDSFYFENDFYHLSGDWGEVKIKSQSPSIKFNE